MVGAGRLLLRTWNEYNTGIYINFGAKAQCIVAPLDASLGGPDEGCHVKPRQRDRRHLVRPLASESAR